jgi:hypothetical protein
MAVIQIQVCNNFIDDVLIDGTYGVNIIIENFLKPNPTPYKLEWQIKP